MWSQGTEISTAAAAVVIYKDDQDVGWRITDEVKMKSAYDADFVALAVARRLAPTAAIHTDCKSAIVATEQRHHRLGVTQVMMTTEGAQCIKCMRTQRDVNDDGNGHGKKKETRRLMQWRPTGRER
jgi:hypothetical protein